MQDIINFFNQPFFAIFGGIQTILFFVSLLLIIYSTIKGTLPIIWRLGTALNKRQIAIFGSAEAFAMLKDILKDSNLFNEKNICHIQHGSIDRAKTKTIYLVHWESFKTHIDEVLLARNDEQTPIVIFANPGVIPIDKMGVIGNKLNTIVVNFKGRLVNDIFVSLMTTNNNKK